MFAKRRKNACYGIEENVFWTLSCLRKSLTKHLLRFNNLPHWNSVCWTKKNACFTEKSVAKCLKSLSELSALRRVYWASFGKRYFSITKLSWNDILYFISILKVLKSNPRFYKVWKLLKNRHKHCHYFIKFHIFTREKFDYLYL